MHKPFQLPNSAYFNKFIPKLKFYEKLSLNPKLQAEFTNKIQRITWKYKLASNTINIAPTEKVEEIQIFEVELKTLYQPLRVLKAIDKAIPYPILYLLSYKDKFAYAIAYDDGEIKQRYYISDWNEEIVFDFTGLNLEVVYQKIIRLFLTNDQPQQEFAELVTTDYEISVTETRIDKLKQLIRREKQFNRKVDLNKQLFQEQEKLKTLKG